MGGRKTEVEKTDGALCDGSILSIVHLPWTHFGFYKGSSLQNIAFIKSVFSEKKGHTSVTSELRTKKRLLLSL